MNSRRGNVFSSQPDSVLNFSRRSTPAGATSTSDFAENLPNACSAGSRRGPRSVFSRRDRRQLPDFMKFFTVDSAMKSAKAI